MCQQMCQQMCQYYERLLCVKVLIIMQKIAQEQKQVPQPHQQDPRPTSHRVQSSFTAQYNSLVEPIDFDQQKVCSLCFKKGIAYNPNSPYQPFQFQVKKTIPNFNYYLVEAKIGHFKMSITALKSENNLTQNLESAANSNEKIYFANISEQSLCFKTYYYSNELEFQKTFSSVVKELTILRICSAVECSLLTDSFLGFDIIIYDNCIQFAMEKGAPIQYLSPPQVKELKEELRLMHQLRIIHFDIKPQNIIFSKHYDKAVFIDFGFSEIIKQLCGYKTLTEFRGTPKFSSPEILQIMITQKSYIDLYYNDAFSLNQVLKLNKNRSNVPSRIKSKKFDRISQDIDDLFESGEDSNQQVRHYISNELDFIFITFQFYYLNSNQVKSRQLLNKWLIDSSKMVKRVLAFIKNIIHYVFLSNLFYGQLKIFSNEQEYCEIQNLQKSNGVRFFFKKSLIYQDELTYEPRQYQPSSFISGQNQQSPQQYHQYINMILKMENLEESFFDNFIAIVFQCLRFSKKNLQLKDKIIIAKKAICLLSNYNDKIKDSKVLLVKEEGNGLQKIKYLFNLIYQHCLMSKCRWYKNNIIDIFQQLIILNTDYQNLLQSLFGYLSQNCQSLQDLIVTLLQTRRLKQAIKMFYTQQYQYIHIIKGKLNAFLQSQQKKIQSLNLSLKDTESISMAKYYFNIFLSSVPTDKNIDLLDFFDKEIKIIKNDKFRKNILQYIILRKLDRVFFFQNTFNILKLATMIRHITTVQNLYFLPYVRITLKLLFVISDFKNLKSFAGYIQNIINCQQISSRLVVIQQGQKDQPDHSIVSSKIMRLNRIIPLIGIINCEILSQLYQIYFRITQTNIVIDQCLKSNLITLYYHYYKCKYFIPFSAKLAAYYYLAFCQSKIEFFFYKLSPQCKQAFLSNLSQNQRKLKLTNLDQQPLQFISYKFKFLCYKYKLSYNNNNYEQSVDEINQLFLICRHLRMDFLGFQIYKEIVFTSCLEKEQIDIVHFIQRLYQMCKQIQYYSFYLLPCNNYYVFTTFVIFARKNQSYFYQFINYLTSFLYVNPIDSYLQILLFTLDKFLRVQSCNSHRLHYTNFIKPSLKVNPYNLIFYVLSLKNQQPSIQLKLFKVIAVNINKLSQYAKRQLLKKYYSVAIDFISLDKKRKRKFVLKQAKIYLNYSKCINQLKDLFKFNRTISRYNGTINKSYKDAINRLFNHLKLYKEQELAIELEKRLY